MSDTNATIAEETPLGSRIIWQDRPRSETGGVLVGDIPETIVPLVIARLEVLNESPNTPDDRTLKAMALLRGAQAELEARRRDRDERGVTGTYAS